MSTKKLNTAYEVNKVQLTSIDPHGAKKITVLKYWIEKKSALKILSISPYL